MVSASSSAASSESAASIVSGMESLSLSGAGAGHDSQTLRAPLQFSHPYSRETLSDLSSLGLQDVDLSGGQASASASVSSPAPVYYSVGTNGGIDIEAISSGSASGEIQINVVVPTPRAVSVVSTAALVSDAVAGSALSSPLGASGSALSISVSESVPAVVSGSQSALALSPVSPLSSPLDGPKPLLDRPRSDSGAGGSNPDLSPTPGSRSLVGLSDARSRSSSQEAEKKAKLANYKAVDFGAQPDMVYELLRFDNCLLGFIHANDRDLFTRLVAAMNVMTEFDYSRLNLKVVTDQHTRPVRRYCTNLQKVTFANVKIERSAIAEIHRMNTVTNLTVAQCFGVHLQDISLRNFPRLQSLTATSFVTDEWLAQLVGLPVTYLNLNGCTEFTDKAMLVIGSLKTLTEFHMSNPSVTRQAIESLAALPSLTTLGLSGCQATDETLEKFAGSPVSQLILAGINGITPRGLGRFFEASKTIARCHVKYCKGILADELLDLQQAYRGKVALRPKPTIPEDVEDMYLVHQNRTVSEILRNTENYQEGNPLSSMPGVVAETITALHLRGVDFTPTKGIFLSNKFKNLRVLSLEKGNIQIEMLSKFGGAFPNLKQLTLNEVTVSTAGALRDEHLQALLQGCKQPLSALHLDQTAVTARGIESVAKELNGLVMISLRACPFLFQRGEPLRLPESVQVLDIRGTPYVTQPIREQLSKQFRLVLE